ncbi:hypothetical protein [Veillonella montpellierensis]|uniref:hypothetical protein n=1 Tax=Veillonella montpellierensis TaxID=187328 RepID=UPI0012DC1263|nr:hypothetical protein [Veillonella montpellierensis]
MIRPEHTKARRRATYRPLCIVASAGRLVCISRYKSQRLAVSSLVGYGKDETSDTPYMIRPAHIKARRRATCRPLCIVVPARRLICISQYKL